MKVEASVFSQMIMQGSKVVTEELCIQRWVLGIQKRKKKSQNSCPSSATTVRFRSTCYCAKWHCEDYERCLLWGVLQQWEWLKLKIKREIIPMEIAPHTVI